MLLMFGGHCCWMQLFRDDVVLLRQKVDYHMILIHSYFSPALLACFCGLAAALGSGHRLHLALLPPLLLPLLPPLLLLPLLPLLLLPLLLLLHIHRLYNNI